MTRTISEADAHSLATEHLNTYMGFEDAELSAANLNAGPSVWAFSVKGRIGHWVSVNDEEIKLHISSTHGVRTIMLESFAEDTDA